MKVASSNELGRLRATLAPRIKAGRLDDDGDDSDDECGTQADARFFVFVFASFIRAVPFRPRRGCRYYRRVRRQSNYEQRIDPVRLTSDRASTANPTRSCAGSRSKKTALRGRRTSQRRMSFRRAAVRLILSPLLPSLRSS